MQAPRNWRTKQERYRLVGSININGDTSVVNRPKSLAAPAQDKQENRQPVLEANAA